MAHYLGVLLSAFLASVSSGQEAVTPPAAEQAEQTKFPAVGWICNDVDAAAPTLETRFLPAAVEVTWRGVTSRLEHVPSEVGAAYVGWHGESSRSFRMRPDDRAVFASDGQMVGCRAKRRGGREPMPKATGSTAGELAVALVMGVPRRTPELLGVVGAIEPDPEDPRPGFGLQWEFRDDGPVSSVSLEPRFDAYHDDLDRPRTELEQWSVSFRGDPAPVREWLRSQYGEPIELTRSIGALPEPQTVWRFAHFYFIDRSSSFEISYRRQEPEWIMPPLDDETARREIARVERVLRGGVRLADIEADFGPLGPDQWGDSFEVWTRHWRIDVTPADGPPQRIFFIPRGRPIPAGSLIHTLRIEHPVVVSKDVHWSERKLEDRDRSTLRVGEWKIEVCIDRDDLEWQETDRHPPTWSSKSFPVCGIALRR